MSFDVQMPGTVNSKKFSKRKEVRKRPIFFFIMWINKRQEIGNVKYNRERDPTDRFCVIRSGQ